MIRPRRGRHAIFLLLALCFAGCEGDQASAPSAPLPAPVPPPPPPPPEPPRPSGEPALLILVQGGAAAEVQVSGLFTVAAGQQSEAAVEVQSANEAVATARLQGSGLTAVMIVTPVAQGDTTVTVTLKTSAGSATQTIPVTVGPPAPEPPRPVGEPPSLQLVVGGSGKDVPVGEYFTVDPSHTEAVEVEVLSEDESVALARLRGTGLMSVVTVEPVGEGFVWIRVIVTTPAGSATQRVGVDVAPAPTHPPRVVYEPRLVNLVAGGAWRTWRLRDLFTTGDRLQDRRTEGEARSEDDRVVTARIEADGLFGELIVTPVSPGETTVVVRAWNAAGSAVLRIHTTVLPAEPPRVTGQLGPLTMVAGSGGSSFGLAGYFKPPGFLPEARSLDETVVLAEADHSGVVSFHAVGPGETFVVVTASNAAGTAEMIVKVTVLAKLRIGLVSRAGPAGGSPVRLAEGGQWNIEIQPLDREVIGAGSGDTVTLGIATDAPADELIVPESITTARLARRSERIFFPIEAPADDTPGEPERTYTVSLVSAAGLPSWMEVSETPLRVAVLDSPAAACEDLWVNAFLDRVSDGMRSGTFRIQAPHPDTSVSWAEPYVNRTGFHLIRPTVATHVFPERLSLGIIY